MTEINLIMETPKTFQRTILAVGQIHYQPHTQMLDVTGWMLIQEDSQPETLPEPTK